MVFIMNRFRTPPLINRSRTVASGIDIFSLVLGFLPILAVLFLGYT